MTLLLSDFQSIFVRFEPVSDIVERTLLKHRRIENNCWISTFKSKAHNGYKGIQILKKKYRVHRVAAMLWLGFDLNSKMEICHSCDNPACFNPEHLFEASHEVNIEDKVNKNRQAKGSIHGRSKLKENDIVKIRLSSLSRKDLAKEFNVTETLIGMIIRNEIWKHVSVPITI